MKLVIAEKPSVAQSYAKALNITAKKSGYFEGNGYIITWCIGHLAGLADAAAYDEKYAVWKYEDLPILPEKWQFAINKGKENQYKVCQRFNEPKRHNRDYKRVRRRTRGRIDFQICI